MPWEFFQLIKGVESVIQSVKYHVFVAVIVGETE